MKKITYLFLLIVFVGCTTDNSKYEEDVPDIPTLFHSLLNEEAGVTLHAKFKKVTGKEAAAVYANPEQSKFLKKVYSSGSIGLLESEEDRTGIFIDTTNYDELLFFKRYPKRVAISKEQAGKLGNLFMEYLRDLAGSKEAVIDVSDAFYDIQDEFNFAHYNMSVVKGANKIYSSQFILSTDNQTYLIYNLSPDKRDIYDLKDNFEFND